MQEYSLEDLIYEYHIVKEKEVYREERAEKEADKMEEAKIQEEENWADQMEAMELEIQATKEDQKPKQEKPEEEPYDPRTDPKNIEWMEKHVEENKLFFGDDYGEDVSLDFNDPEDE